MFYFILLFEGPYKQTYYTICGFHSISQQLKMGSHWLYLHLHCPVLIRPAQERTKPTKKTERKKPEVVDHWVGT